MMADVLDDFGVFNLYMACKLHYSNGSYNAIKYNFRTRTKENTFWKRKDRYFFHKLNNTLNHNREEVIDYFNAQFVAGNEWIGDMVGDEAVWNLHQKKMQSFHYNFEKDINTIHTEVCNEGTLPFDSVFDIDDDESHPPIIKLLLQDDIMIETVIVLNELLGFVPRLKITETLVWPDLKNKILKYGNMLDGKINTKKCKKTLLSVFTF